LDRSSAATKDDKIASAATQIEGVCILAIDCDVECDKYFEERGNEACQCDSLSYFVDRQSLPIPDQSVPRLTVRNYCLNECT
jgi:hypothetical protein